MIGRDGQHMLVNHGYNNVGLHPYNFHQKNDSRIRSKDLLN